MADVTTKKSNPTCSCGDPSRQNINHRKRIPCWTYIGDIRSNVDENGHVIDWLLIRTERDRHRENEKWLRERIWEYGLSHPPGSPEREWASTTIYWIDD